MDPPEMENLKVKKTHKREFVILWTSNSQVQIICQARSFYSFI